MTRRKLYRADLAARLGINAASLDRAGLPPRDGTDIDGGHARPYWYEGTIEAWEAARPGKGWRAGQPGSHEQRRQGGA